LKNGDNCRVFFVHFSEEIIMKTIFAIVFGLGILSVGQAQDLNELYRNGVQAYNEGSYDEALTNFLRIDSVRTGIIAVDGFIARLYGRAGNPAEAVPRLERMTLINPDTSLLSLEDFDAIRATAEFQAVQEAFENMLKYEGNGQVVNVIPERDLHAESIAIDPRNGDMYVSSIHKRKIIRINSRGQMYPFVTTGQDGIWAVTGMQIDTSENALWACSAIAPQMLMFDENLTGLSGVFKFELRTGRLLDNYLMIDSVAHYFGDLTIHPVTGDIYVSDSNYPAVFRIDTADNDIKIFQIYREMNSLQGIDFDATGNYLYIADYSSGLYQVDMRDTTYTAKLITHGPSLSTRGTDGLYCHGNDLIIIQNGVRPFRITRLDVDRQTIRVRNFSYLEKANPNFGEPTLGTIVGDEFFYIANSQWGAYLPDGTIFPFDRLRDILIMKSKLEP
jgi:sugar lactone lactonase YvrE